MGTKSEYPKEGGGQAFPGMQGQTVAGTWWEPGQNLRAYAAIQLRVPDSGIDWLDAMIREKARRDLAGQAMQGLIFHLREEDVREHEGDLDLERDWSAWAFLFADAMLAEQEKSHV